MSGEENIHDNPDTVFTSEEEVTSTDQQKQKQKQKQKQVL